jgi:micrococcal nuclease
VASVIWAHVGPSRDDWSTFDHRTFTVTRVIDGDTIVIRNGEDDVIVGLVGIDAPPLHDPTTGQPAHWAERAAAYTRARAEGKTVTLRLEPVQTRDREGRLLAYVYLLDSDCLNIDMVHDGEAYAYRTVHHSYRAQYEQAENDARKRQRGLWKDITEDQMPPWRRAWLHARDQ